MKIGITYGMDVEELLKVTKASFPSTEGIKTIAGLSEEVEILWDDMGIPHIYAKTLHDAMRTQGYLHGKFRLWQMELYRRKFKGRLSEILGKATLDSDKHSRIIGFNRILKKYSNTVDDYPELKEVLHSYTSGVNLAVAEAKEHPPMEFATLGIAPEDWTIEDCMLIVLMLDWVESLWNEPLEVLRAYLVKKIGEEAAERLFPLYNGTNLDGVPGSNAWAIHPDKTATGAPLLASDPHLAYSLPCIWFIVHIITPEQNVIGVSVPGAPGILIGHNEYIGWGITNVQADTQDLFEIKINPKYVEKYWLDGNWVDFTIIKEQIRVKGLDKPVVENVRHTVFGPIIKYLEKLNSMFPFPLEKPHALRWSGHDMNPLDSLECFRRLNQAHNWDEFKDAISCKSTCPHNFIFSSINGRIAHHHAGVIPIRAIGNGTIPALGESSENNWKGYTSFDDLWCCVDPGEGHVCTANYNPMRTHKGILIAMDSIGYYRYLRIKDLLDSKGTFTLEDCAGPQLDVLSKEAQQVLPVMLSTIGKDAEDILPPEVMKDLESWNFKLEGSSIPAAIYKVWSHFALIELLVPILEPALLELYLEAPPFELDRMIKYWENEDDMRDKLKRALIRTREYLLKRVSEDTRKWNWDRFHKLELVHPFSLAEPEAKILNIGFFRLGGDRHCLNNAHCDPGDGFKVIAGPSYRQVLNFSDWDKSMFALPGAQSGLPFHPHYNDLIKKWAKGQYLPLLYSRDKILGKLESKQLLQPDL